MKAINEIKKNLILNAKNVIGWKTDRKIVVFSVDDYGNVRLDSRKARNRLDDACIKVKSKFKGLDLYDSLETRDDLTMLYDVLSSVKDKNGRYAVFTPFAVPYNINFEKIEEDGYQEYSNELLPDTYEKLSHSQPDSYQGAWELWMEGIDKELMIPQFHGREHLNVNVFNEMLQKRDPSFMTILKNRSFSRLPSINHITISPVAAFDFWNPNENKDFEYIIESGLNAFEKVFGYRAVHFNAPAGRENSMIHQYLKNNGIRYIDTPMIKKEHQGMGKYSVKFNYTGKRNSQNQLFLVRNVVFEPTREITNHGVDYSLKQIEASFRWKRPAIISSHRVNFCGHINEENRKKGLGALKQLLSHIVKKWPDVEFFSADELGELIDSESA
ncbi:MAG: hypothetical protein ACFCU6_08770 [Balneolaceae bacterium]